MDGDKLYGGIEAGGTKFVCAVATAPDTIIDQIAISTSTPQETLESVVTFFERYPKLERVGIASFGPLDLQTGTITTTPKDGWQNVTLGQTIGEKLGTPVIIDTDVDGAVLGEKHYGAGSGVTNLAYITVGTGIGVGSIIGGQLVKGSSHTETGHILIPRLPDDCAPSSCPFHDSCFEGLASGTALRIRGAGQSAEEITDKDIWEREATYLAYGLADIILMTAPERIIIGGGVMGHEGLLDAVRTKLIAVIGGYISLPDTTTYLVPPGLGPLSGITGALLLAAQQDS